MAQQANFAATPRRSSILVNTANTDTTGTGGGAFPVVFTAGVNGSRVDTLQVKAIVAEGVTQAADSVRLWLVIGGTRIFLKEILVPAGAGVVSATQANFETVLPLGIVLQANEQLAASTHLGNGAGTAGYHLTGFGGDF